MTPQAKGGHMAKVYNYEDDFMKVIVKFGGRMKYLPLRLLPYLTETAPKIKLNISLKKSDLQITVIEIACDEPLNPPERHYSLDNYGWFTTDIRTNSDYKITLPDLLSGGCEYRYRLNVHLLFANGNAEMTRGGLIMTTGYVSYKGKFTLGVIAGILTFIGSGITLLIQWLMRLSSSGG